MEIVYAIIDCKSWIVERIECINQSVGTVFSARVR